VEPLFGALLPLHEETPPVMRCPKSGARIY
jgi:hypothetical protein